MIRYFYREIIPRLKYFIAANDEPVSFKENPSPCRRRRRHRQRRHSENYCFLKDCPCYNLNK